MTEKLRKVTAEEYKALGLWADGDTEEPLAAVVEGVSLYVPESFKVVTVHDLLIASYNNGVQVGERRGECLGKLKAQKAMREALDIDDLYFDAKESNKC